MNQLRDQSGKLSVRDLHVSEPARLRLAPQWYVNEFLHGLCCFRLVKSQQRYENGTLAISTCWCTVTFLVLLLIPVGAWLYARTYVRPDNEQAYQVIAVAAFRVA